MQIALVYDAIYPFVSGGAERRNYAVAEALRREHGVALYGFRYWNEAADDCLPGCRYVPVGPPMELYDSRGQRRIAEAVIFAGRLFVALCRSTEDVWDVAHCPVFSVLSAWLASKLRRRKLVVTWHEFWGSYWREYLGRGGGLAAAIERLALRCSPHVITGSEHARRRLMAAGYPAERISLVPNGVDHALITSVPPAEASSDLIYVGRLLPHKRVDLLLAAVRRLREKHPHITLAIVGDGPERSRLERLADELGVAPAVCFTGRLASSTEVYARLKSSRVFVTASQREGFGIAAVEAWACGLPVVVCEGSENALPELIDCDLKGRVAAPDAASIGAACRELLGQPREAHRAERIAAAADYDWSRIARRLAGVYASLP